MGWGEPRGRDKHFNIESFEEDTTDWFMFLVGWELADDFPVGLPCPPADNKEDRNNGDTQP